MCKGRGSEDVGISVNMEFCGWRGIVFGYDSCVRCLRILLGKSDLGVCGFTILSFYQTVTITLFYQNQH